MNYLKLLLFAFVMVLVVHGTSGVRRPRRSVKIAQFSYVVSPANRTLCGTGDDPPNRVDTASRVAALRAEMTALSLDAYFIPLEDEHGQEGSAYDARLQYISGFSGSNGWAWVTATEQALWTDGRYFTQAEQQLDCNWILMKEGQIGYPTAQEWLVQQLPRDAIVGADSKLVGISNWQSYVDALAVRNITLIEVAQELIDVIWTTDRPARPNNEIYVHDISYTGESWAQKIDLIRAELTTAGADLYIMTALDETAWTFNLRGSDMPTSPTFYSYGIITHTLVRLYLSNFTYLLTSTIQNHLNTKPDGTCVGQSNLCVEVGEYTQVFNDLAAFAGNHSKLWVDPFSSYKTYSSAGDHRYVEYSPVQLMKSIKTDTERSKYKECQIRDSAALVEFVSLLEQEVLAGAIWTEMTISEELKNLRSQYPDNKGLSFDTIAGFAENGAVIHYRPTPETDKTITTNDLLLLDSGGQYLDGTTDVTRTFHYGTPSNEHIEAYTRVLMGAIDLAMAVWPEGTYGRDIDVFARNYLWTQGLDYNHGTGHGIAYFINVHEGPGRINQGYNPSHKPLYEGMFFSDEPGFYKDGAGGYGVRLETIVGVEEAKTDNQFNGVKYLAFEPVTFVPFEPKLIRVEWLNKRQRQWLNNYHSQCMQKTLVYLENNRPAEVVNRARAWMEARVAAIPEDDCATYSSGSRLRETSCFWIIMSIIASILLNM